MAKALVLILLLPAVSVVSASASAADPHAVSKVYRLRATLTPGQVVTPQNKKWHPPASLTRARGTFSGTISADGRTLRWRISYANFGRREFVLADVHIGKPGRWGAILVRLCSDCRSGQTGVKRLKRGDSVQFSLGNTWLSMGTDKYPNGVVRGQIRVRN